LFLIIVFGFVSFIVDENHWAIFFLPSVDDKEAY